MPLLHQRVRECALLHRAATAVGVALGEAGAALGEVRGEATGLGLGRLKLNAQLAALVLERL
jgi:hypothetical protein